MKKRSQHLLCFRMSGAGEKPRFLALCNTAAEPQRLHAGESRPLKSHPGKPCDRNMQGKAVPCHGTVILLSLQSFRSPRFSCCYCICLLRREKFTGPVVIPDSGGGGEDLQASPHVPHRALMLVAGSRGNREQCLKQRESGGPSCQNFFI